ncbi:MAG: zinc finger domain-containing protein, partial [Bacteroidota bacterium]
WTLSFNSLRKFSRLELVEDIPSYQKQKKLGPDATLISKEEFADALLKKGTQIKPALLQQKHFAGIGNWIADEMLHWVQIHPEARCKTISREQYYDLHAALQEIIQVTLDYGGDYGSFPPKFMVRVREDGGSCPRCDDELTRLVVGGRGTYICNRCQAEPQLES